MRLITFVIPDGTPGSRAGVLLPGGDVLDIAAADPDLPADLLSILRLGQEGLDAVAVAWRRVIARGGEPRDGTAVTHRRGAVRLLPPLPRPNSIRCFSLIEEHMLAAIETLTTKMGDQAPAISAIPAEWYNLPAYFKKNPDEVYGPDDEVPWPAMTAKLDFEFELAAVIGKTGRNLTAEQAREHIAGYTIFNDWSARDYQQREMSVNLGPGLCKDFASSLGPAIATPDEFAPDSSPLSVRVDGELWKRGTAKMRIDFAEVIASVSSVQTVHPGDVLTSGTIGGGAGIESDRWIREGSVVEFEAEGIGVLRNTVGKRGAAVALPASQRL